VKRRDSEQWMRHRNLPHDIVQRVRRYDQYKWVATRGVNEEMLVQSLPSDLRRDIKRHLCLNLVRNVSLLSSPLLQFFITTLVFGFAFFGGVLTSCSLRCRSLTKWTRACWTRCASG
jgi:hypothetical protein